MGERHSLAEVYESLLLSPNGTRAFGPMGVWVVHYSAPNPYPRRFIYSACVSRTELGRKCLKSVELGRTCQHTEGTQSAFRFKVTIVDCHRGAVRPLTVNIWQAAAEFLRCSAKQFSTCPEPEQVSYLQDLMETTPRVLVNLKIGDGQVHVQCLSWCEGCAIPLPSSIRLGALTPAASSSIGTPVTGKSSVKSRSKASRKSEVKAGDLKFLVKGLTKLFEASGISDDSE